MYVTIGSLKRLTQLLAGQEKTSVSITGGAIDGTAIGGTTPSTGAFTTISGTSLNTTGVNAVSVANALTATGTDRATSLALTKAINNVTTTATGTGVTLPSGVVGQRIVVYNAGTQTLKVYGAGSDKIDGTAGSTGVSLSTTKRCEFTCVAANTIISAQLGAVSA